MSSPALFAVCLCVCGMMATSWVRKCVWLEGGTKAEERYREGGGSGEGDGAPVCSSGEELRLPPAGTQQLMPLLQRHLSCMPVWRLQMLVMLFS